MPIPLPDARKSPLLRSLALNAVLFGLTLLLLRPVYGTVEDVYVLYQLSGGFGSAPTELLHYNHILNPILGYGLKTLFIHAPGVNWYTAALLVGHFVACTVISACLLRRYAGWAGCLCYCFFFFVFEARFLGSINFSNSALILALAGLLLVLSEATMRDRPRTGVLIVAASLVVAASLFRIHSWLPLLLLLAPLGLLVRGWRLRGRIALVAAAALLTVFLLHLFQEQHYRRNSPGWAAEEAYRQRVYAFYNHRNIRYPAAGTALANEGAMVRHGMLIDSNLLTPAVLERLYQRSRMQYRGGSPVNRWFFINNRLFFFSLLSLLLFVRGRAERLAVGGTVVLFILLALYLLFGYGKMPDYLLQGLLAAVVLGGLMSGTMPRRRAFLLLPLVLAAWGLWLQLRLDRGERLMTARFDAACREIAAQPQALFFVSTDGFPLQHLSAYTIPRQRPLHNFLSGEHFLQGIAQPTLQRFGISSARALAPQPGVYFAQWSPELLRWYFQQVNGHVLNVRPAPFAAPLLAPYQLIDGEGRP
ncbi:hypothetical protein [Flaviaesturariibacter terrae]